MEKFFETIFNSVNDGILIYDLEGRFLEVNQITCDNLGYQKDELLQMTGMDIIPPELGEKFIGQIFEKMNQGGGIIETMGRCKDGSLVPIEFNIRPIKYKGNPAILAVVRDITERKKAEKDLRESEYKFKTLFENANDAIYLTGLNGQLLEVNQMACDQLGYSRSELLQMKPQDIDVIDDLEKVGARINKILQDEHIIFETTHVRKDGSLMPAEISSRLIDYKGKKAILGISRDISKHKKAEEAMINSKLAAEAANHAKSEFLTNMSHELRTPLNSIIGFSDILCSEDFGALNETQKHYLYNVNKSGKHLLELINDMLDLSKIEAGKMKLFPEKFVVLDTINGIKSTMLPLAKKKDIDLKCSINIEDSIIVADALKFKQILYNLVSNAIKFTNRGGSVTIGVDRSDDQIFIFVEDTGSGISQNDQQKLFDPFIQLNSSLSKEYNGTGLGLALVKYFVDMHGGKVWVDSEVGKGSTFGFSIPTNLENTSSY
ncbi:PAS domain-containing sensor histidine kinase [Methanococcoides sp. AM1]|uniref:sensor histidine kinase n=1 Tax=Methanococcoides sp. AM1 TaxID=1201011 RepID=UPI001FCE6B50|nr:PAS domain-containing sensor histidine kinase [Methanococcoides sp. AM1]